MKRALRYFSTEAQTAAVKQLRKSTGAPLMQCKKALDECEGEVDRARQWLKEKGALVAEKKHGRETASGLAGLFMNQDRSKVSMLQLNCETDFVVKSQDFLDMGQSILAHLHSNIRAFDFKNADAFPFQLNAFLLTRLSSGFIVKEALTQLINKTQENVNLTKLYQKEPSSSTITGGYIHRDLAENVGGIACTVFLNCGATVTQENRLKLHEFADQLATHITGMQPKYTAEEFKALPYVIRQKDIVLEFGEGSQVKDRQNDYMKKRILEKQEYVFENDKTVEEKLAALSREVGVEVKVKEFVMIACD